MNLKRTIPGVVIGLAGVVVFTVALLHVTAIGTCASGGPYVSARPCPSGTGGWIGLLTGGILVTVLGMMISGGMWGGGLLVWSALFAGSGTAMVVQGLTENGLGTGSQGTDYIVGGVFILIGGVPLVWMIASGLSSLRAKRVRARSKEVDATISRVQELKRLRFNQVQVRLSYAVQPLDDASFELSREMNVLATQMPHMGQRVKVRYEPANHAKFEVVTPSLAPSAATMATIARGVPMVSVGAVTRPPVAAEPDPLDRLQELVKLRDEGALTPTEFETQKAKILAQT